jgi:nucleoid-associated protein YgaU
MSTARLSAAEESQGFWERLRETGAALTQEMRERARVGKRKGADQSFARDGEGAETGVRSDSVQAPSFSRIVIESNGAAHLQGRGSPSSDVIISASGKIIAVVRVDRGGEWRSKIAAGLAPGEFHVTTVARAKVGSPITTGQDLRIRVPAGFSDRVVVLYNGAVEEPDPARQRAEELADAATRKFTEVIRGKEKQSKKTTAAEPPAKNQNTLKEVEESILTAGERIQDWLAKANRTYQSQIARKLSVPVNKPAQTAEATPEQLVAPEKLAQQEADAERRRREVADRQRREAEAAREAQEQARLAAEKQRADEEASRQREIEARERAARAEAARLEAERRAAEVRRLAEAARAQEEAKRLAEESEKAARKLTAEDEEKKREEAKRLVDEAERKDAERKRRAEEQEELRRNPKSEQQREKEAEIRRKDEEVLAQQAEAEQLASDLERRTDRPMPVDPPKGLSPEALEAEGSEQAPAESVSEPTRKGKKDLRPSEGSAEEPSPPDAALETVQESPRVCRIGKTKRRRRSISYVVKPGDTLWSISRRYLGRGARYPVIFRANRDRLHDPDFLLDCQRIVVPRKKRPR